MEFSELALAFFMYFYAKIEKYNDYEKKLSNITTKIFFNKKYKIPYETSNYIISVFDIK